MATEEDLRRIALSLPETSERLTWGTPGFRVKDKLFARIREDPDALVLWRPSVEDRDALIAGDPETFFTTAHYAGHASVLLRLPAVDADELRELLVEAWQVRAPARLRAATNLR